MFTIPKFLVSVASPVFPRMKFLYKNKEYLQAESPQFDFPSVHLHGTQDQYKEMLTCHRLFTQRSQPVLITFNEAHKFPRCIDDHFFRDLKEFVRGRFVDKNGTAAGSEGFEVNYEQFNFEVRV